ncbi:g11616 [Coccomyxa elongata]
MTFAAVGKFSTKVAPWGSLKQGPRPRGISHLERQPPRAASPRGSDNLERRNRGPLARGISHPDRQPPEPPCRGDQTTLSGATGGPWLGGSAILIGSHRSRRAGGGDQKS